MVLCCYLGLPGPLMRMFLLSLLPVYLNDSIGCIFVGTRYLDVFSFDLMGVYGVVS